MILDKIEVLLTVRHTSQAMVILALQCEGIQSSSIDCLKAFKAAYAIATDNLMSVYNIPQFQSGVPHATHQRSMSQVYGQIPLRYQSQD